MYEKREYKIRSKIFKPEDIRRIAKLIEEMTEEFIDKIPQKDRRCDLSYSIESVDGATYSSNSKEIFQPESLIDTKNIKRVNMSFDSYQPRASVKITISDSRYGYSNYLEISGSDSTWVNGIYNKLLDTINSCQMQNSLGTKFKWPLSILSSLLIGLALVGVINLILNITSESRTQIPYWSALAILGICFGISTLIEKVWPEVEIISGNKKLHASSKIEGIFYIIIIPFIVALIANLIFELLN
jgi:hypothetical protein